MRKNDRNYAVGDILILKLWEPRADNEGHFVLNETVVKRVTHILHDYDFSNLPDGWCILSLEDV